MNRKKKRDWEPFAIRNFTNRSVTNRSVATGDIITLDQLKEALGDKPLEALLNCLDDNSVLLKIETLHNIDNYVIENTYSLLRNYSSVLSKLGKALIESDPVLPELTVKVIATCLDVLSDPQYKMCSETMEIHLICMMFHGKTLVKKASLHLLEALLATHPKLVTEDSNILLSLLNMISVKRAGEDRKLVDLSSSESYLWRQEVLHGVLLFLQAMMDPEENPRKVDCLKDSIIKGPDCVEFKKLIFQLVQMLSDVVVGEMPHLHTLQMQQDVILSPTNVKYLNLIVQLLCYAGESRQRLQFEENEVQTLSQQIQDVSLQILNGFPYAQRGHTYDDEGKKAKEPECVQLNLGTCYLYTTYLLESDDARLKYKEKAVLNYLTEFCVNNLMSDKSILLIIKMSKIFMESKFVNLDFKNSTKVRLYQILEIYVNFNKRVHSKMLYSFFMEWSLEDASCNLIKAEDMVLWFRAVFKKLVFMVECITDLELLFYAKKLCTKKYPKLLEVFSSVEHKDICKLLQFGDADIQAAIIHMITSLDNIPHRLLHELSDLISQKDNSTSEMSITLINQLHTRFSNSGVSTEEKILFVKFLLNIACDTRSLKVPLRDFNNKEVMDVLFAVLGKTRYRLYLTKKWTMHQNIFEVCLKCLLKYCEDDLVAQEVLEFARTFLLANVDFIPLHAVLAFLHIRQKVVSLHQDRNVITLSYNLIFSSFMYISVITYIVPDQCQLYYVTELQSCLLANCDAHEISRLIQVNGKTFEDSCEKVVFYALRIVKFLFLRYKIDSEDLYMGDLLGRIGFKFQESWFLSPLWREICNT